MIVGPVPPWVIVKFWLTVNALPSGWAKGLGKLITIHFGSP